MVQAVTNSQEQKLFLLCLEELVGTVEKKLLPRIPIILQKLYDLDLIEEDTIIVICVTVKSGDLILFVYQGMGRSSSRDRYRTARCSNFRS